MRSMTTLLLAAAAAAFSTSAAFAEAPAAPAAINPALQSAPSVTAPAIAWPVVHAPAGSTTVHMAPGEPEAAATPPPEPTLTVDIDLGSQSMTVAENGMAKYTWAISSARAGYRTPTGTFKPTWTSKMWYSRQYDMAPMPHAVFFSGGVAIHATYATGMLGNPASHGCVRLAPKNASTFYSLVNKHGKDLTRITVHGVPKGGNSFVASKRRNDAQRYAQLQSDYGYTQGFSLFGYSQPYYVQQRPANYAPAKKPRNAQRAAARGYAYGYGN